MKHVPWFPAKRGMGNMGGVAVYRPEHQVLQIVLLSGRARTNGDREKRKPNPRKGR